MSTYLKNKNRIQSIIDIYNKYDSVQKENFKYLLDDATEYDLSIFNQISYQNGLRMFALNTPNGIYKEDSMYIRFVPRGRQPVKFSVYVRINGFTVIIPVKAFDSDDATVLVAQIATSISCNTNHPNVDVIDCYQIISNDEIIYNSVEIV